MKSSSFFSLGWSDLGKGLIMVVLGAVFGVVQGSINAGSFAFNFTDIWHASLAAGVTYLAKNLLTNSSGTFASTEKK